MPSLISDPAASAAAGSQPPAGQQPQGQQGNQPPAAFDFRTILPEDIRGEKMWETFKPKDQNEFVQQLSKGYVESQRLIGKKGLIVPDDNAPPEKWAEFYKALGRPDSPDGYEVKPPEGMTLDSEEDKAALAAWKKELHEAGVPAKTAARLVGKYLSDRHAERSALAKEQENWVNQTKTKFGEKLDENVNFAKHALRQIGTPELSALLDSSGLGNHPAVVEAFAKAGRALSEGAAPRSPGATGGAVTTPDAAQAEIATFDRTHAEAIFDANHKDHDWAVKRRAELFQIAYPVKKTV